MEDTDMSYLEIEKVTGRQIIDSRGNPTVEAEVVLKDGMELSAEELLHRERQPENLKLWSSGIWIRRSSEEKAFRKQLQTSMRKLRLY